MEPVEKRRRVISVDRGVSAIVDWVFELECLDVARRDFEKCPPACKHALGMQLHYSAVARDSEIMVQEDVRPDAKALNDAARILLKVSELQVRLYEGGLEPFDKALYVILEPHKDAVAIVRNFMQSCGSELMLFEYRRILRDVFHAS